MAYGNNPYIDMMSNLSKYTGGNEANTTSDSPETQPGYVPPSQNVRNTPGAEPRSVESMMSAGADDAAYTGPLGQAYLQEFLSRLTSMDAGQKSAFKSHLGGGIDASEWAGIVGLEPAERNKYSEWFGGLPSFSDLMSNIANVEEYGKARKKQARSSLRARAMQPETGRQSGFAGGRAMLSGALKGSLLRDALNTQMFAINEDVGRRYGQLTASVSDALSKAYSNLRALRTQMPEEEGVGTTSGVDTSGSLAGGYIPPTTKQPGQV